MIDFYLRKVWIHWICVPKMFVKLTIFSIASSRIGEKKEREKMNHEGNKILPILTFLVYLFILFYVFSNKLIISHFIHYVLWQYNYSSDKYLFENLVYFVIVYSCCKIIVYILRDNKLCNFEEKKQIFKSNGNRQIPMYISY